MALDRKGINLLVAAITVLAVALLTWAYIGHWQTGSQQAQVLPHMAPPVTVPAGMPKGIVVVNDARVLSSYTGTTPQGKSQETVIFETGQPTEAVFESYISYFSQNAWKVSDVQMVPTGSFNKTVPISFSSASFVATKQNDQLTVSLSTESTSTRIVSVIMLSATP